MGEGGAKAKKEKVRRVTGALHRINSAGFISNK